MPDQEAAIEENVTTEVAELRAQVAEYQRIFDKAAPRLAAFRQLEELARERKTDPAAVAAEAAIEVLKREQEDLEQQRAALAEQRDNLEKEVAMLLGQKQDEIEIIDEITIESHDIHQEVGEILDELLALREDAVKLMAEKSDLELRVQALHLEVALLEEKKTKGADPDTSEVITDITDITDSDSDTRPSRSRASDFEKNEDNEEEEERLFDEFFHAKVEHDKARDWMLG